MEHISSEMTSAEAHALFRGLPPVTIAEMAGDWKGAPVQTGHPLDPLLEIAHWHGKRFRGDQADPLVHNGPFGRYRVNPGLLPLGAAMALRLDRWPVIGPVLFLLGPLFVTRRPRARLRTIEFEGTVSAAMVYDQKPIIDHFRRGDADTLLGLMDRRGEAAPCFFTLRREG